MGQNTLREFETEFTLIKEKVEYILKENEFARGDDTTLTFLYWLKFESLENFADKMIYVYQNYSNIFDMKGKLTPPGSITRARRIIQNEEKKYLPNPHIIKERIERQEAIKEFMVKTKNE